MESLEFVFSKIPAILIMQAGHRHPYEGFHCNLYIEGYHCNYISPYRANSIKIHGIHYKSGVVVRVTVQLDQSEIPFQYAKIKDFYIYKDHKIFIVQKLR